MKFNEYLSKFEELNALYEAVKQDFAVKGRVHHNWNHVQRDLAKGIIIGEKEKANMKIVLASVLLHDIRRLYPELGKGPHSIGTKVAPMYLENAGFTEEEIKEIVHCVRSYTSRAPEEPKTLEAKVSYDVDVFSCGLGYLGAARVFDFFMREMGIGVKKIVKMPSGRREGRKDFYTNG